MNEPRNTSTKAATVNYVDCDLSKTADPLNVQTMRAIIKKRMERAKFVFDRDSFTETINWLTHQKKIAKIGAGTNARYQYIQQIADENHDAITMPDAWMTTESTPTETTEFTPSRTVGHDWQGQGKSVKPDGKNYWVHPGAVRPGCMDAMECPSLFNGQRKLQSGSYIGQGPRAGQITTVLVGRPPRKAF